jgi:hypothetical protein
MASDALSYSAAYCGSANALVASWKLITVTPHVAAMGRSVDMTWMERWAQCETCVCACASVRKRAQSRVCTCLQIHMRVSPSCVLGVPSPPSRCPAITVASCASSAESRRRHRCGTVGGATHRLAQHALGLAAGKVLCARVLQSGVVGRATFSCALTTPLSTPGAGTFTLPAREICSR